ncbi:hypothetical protein OHR68_06380 [Spirillospora sp. NBC_00431]
MVATGRGLQTEPGVMRGRVQQTGQVRNSPVFTSVRIDASIAV